MRTIAKRAFCQTVIIDLWRIFNVAEKNIFTSTNFRVQKRAMLMASIDATSFSWNIWRKWSKYQPHSSKTIAVTPIVISFCFFICVSLYIEKVLNNSNGVKCESPTTLNHDIIISLKMSFITYVHFRLDFLHWKYLQLSLR